MKLLLKKCGCDYDGLVRAPRSGWMRLFPSRRLYFCRNCKSSIFANRLSIEGTPEWQATSMKLFFPKATDIKTE